MREVQGTDSAAPVALMPAHQVGAVPESAGLPGDCDPPVGAIGVFAPGIGGGQVLGVDVDVDRDGLFGESGNGGVVAVSHGRGGRVAVGGAHGFEAVVSRHGSVRPVGGDDRGLVHGEGAATVGRAVVRVA